MLPVDTETEKRVAAEYDRANRSHSAWPEEPLTRRGDHESHLADVSRDLLPGEERQGSKR